MTGAGTVYAQGLFSLASDEGCAGDIFRQLQVLEESFRQEPAFLRLLGAPNISKEERCRVVDESLRGRVHPYLLNLLKLLTQRGYARHFYDFCKAYKALHYEAEGILEVQAVTAIPLTAPLQEKLTKKLSDLTGKTVLLTNRIDEGCLGGIRLDYDGKRIDDTLAHRLESIGAMLRNTVL